MSDPVRLEPVALEGKYVRLEPLLLAHHADLCQVGLDEDLLRWTESYIPTPDGLRAYIETALRLQAEGSALPFVVISKAVSRPIGSTRYGDIDTVHFIFLHYGHLKLEDTLEGGFFNIQVKSPEGK